jgi:hypothetical protein
MEGSYVDDKVELEKEYDVAWISQKKTDLWM